MLSSSSVIAISLVPFLWCRQSMPWSTLLMSVSLCMLIYRSSKRQVLLPFSIIEVQLPVMCQNSKSHSAHLSQFQSFMPFLSMPLNFPTDSWEHYWGHVSPCSYDKFNCNILLNPFFLIAISSMCPMNPRRTEFLLSIRWILMHLQLRIALEWSQMWMKKLINVNIHLQFSIHTLHSLLSMCMHTTSSDSSNHKLIRSALPFCVF